VNIKNRIGYLEDRAANWRGGLPVEMMSGAELESIIADSLGISPDAITDELLQTIISEAKQ
jgi:hypothetical protein